MENNEIIDIDLSSTRKKKFRIDGDPNRILELNTSDMGIVSRANKSYKKLEKLAEKALKMQEDFTNKVGDDTSEEELDKIANAIEQTDAEMRKILDEIFDSNVSEVCAPFGTMFDFLGGSLRFEHILKVLVKLYNKNISEEYELMTKKMAKHTDKYTK